MQKKHYLLIYLISLAFFFAISFMQKTPGYMDASYYYATGEQIAHGRGASEPFIWNYLNDPQELPGRAFSYWMPLSAIIASLGMWIFQSTEFWAARIPFIFLAALIPLFSVYFTTKITKKRIYIILAVMISLFSGYYLPYLTITETFTPFFVLGGIYFVLAWNILEKNHSDKQKKWVYLLLGLIAGLMNLTRADGIIWIFGIFLLSWIGECRSKEERIHIGKYVSLCGLALLGYLVVMSGWFLRNFTVYHNIFPSGSNLTVWFTQYDDLFWYPANSLTPQRWINQGFKNILLVRGRAGVDNLGTLMAITGNIILSPFMVIGLWNSRKQKITQFTLIMITILFFLMTFIFPFAGSRGGFFHSMSAFQVLLWTAAISGIDLTIAWTVRKLRWVNEKAQRLFCITIVIGIASISFAVCFLKIYDSNLTSNSWDIPYSKFNLMDESLLRKSKMNDFIVMVNDSPGYYAATGRNAIQLTSGTIPDVIELMEKFGIQYLLVDKNVPKNLDPLFQNPGDQEGLEYLGEIEGSYVYTLK